MLPTLILVLARTATPKTDNNKPQNNNSKTALNKALFFLLAFVLYAHIMATLGERKVFEFLKNNAVTK